MYTKEESQELRHQFWHKLESKSRRIPGQNGKAIKWIGEKTEIKGLDLRFDVDREHAIVAMEIHPKSAEKREALWQKMLNCKTLFEETFGGELIWDHDYTKESGEVVSRIYVSTTGDIYNEELWRDMIHFLIDNMLKMERAFTEVKDYLMHF